VAETKLALFYIAEDALTNPAGRLSLYNLFAERYAAVWPAVAERLVVACIWVREGERRTHSQRVAVLSPAGELVDETGGEFEIGGQRMFHIHVHHFHGIVLPGPGSYRVQAWLDRALMADLPLAAISTQGEETTP